MSHKYSVNQTVKFTAGAHERSFAGLYKIISRLPEERGEVQYRIKSTRDSHERVVREGQITQS